MRAVPSVAFEARSFGAWRAGVVLVALVAVAAVGAWLAGGGPPGIGLFLIAVAAACAMSLWRQRPFWLEWDGTCWALLQEGGEAAAGEFDVVIDLGTWMLLRWRTEGRTTRRWLPVQAGDAGPSWRAFRVAAYCRPYVGAASSAGRGSDG